MFCRSTGVSDSLEVDPRGAAASGGTNRLHSVFGMARWRFPGSFPPSLQPPLITSCEDQLPTKRPQAVPQGGEPQAHRWAWFPQGQPSCSVLLCHGSSLGVLFLPLKDCATLSSVKMFIFSLRLVLSMLPHSGCFISSCLLIRLAAREEVEGGPAFPSSLGGWHRQSGPVVTFYDLSQP